MSEGQIAFGLVFVSIMVTSWLFGWHVAMSVAERKMRELERQNRLLRGRIELDDLGTRLLREIRRRKV